MLTLIGFDLKEQLQQSRYFSIWRAERKHDQKAVIVKTPLDEFPPPQAIKRLTDEYEIGQRLQGDYNNDYLDLETCDKRLVLVKTDKHLQSLANVMSQHTLQLKTKLHIICELAKELHKLHGLGFIHNAIKPGHILVDCASWEIQYTDFSSARPLKHIASNRFSKIVDLAELVYFSPEQTGRMNRQVDYRTDFYSFGIILYELLTGKLPFEATTVLSLIYAHLTYEPPTPHACCDDIPKMLSAIVMKLLAKEPEQRYQSAKGLLHDLSRVVKNFDSACLEKSFPLAQIDKPEVFIISDKLYGRVHEIRKLHTALARTDPNLTEMVFVTGYSGAGKTALVRELLPALTKQGGYLISGKFEKNRQSIAYDGLTQSLRGLMKQLLGESEAQLLAWKDTLISALRGNGQLLIDLIPELELVIGQQTAIPSLE